MFSIRFSWWLIVSILWMLPGCRKTEQSTGETQSAAGMVEPSVPPTSSTSTSTSAPAPAPAPSPSGSLTSMVSPGTSQSIDVVPKWERPGQTKSASSPPPSTFNLSGPEARTVNTARDDLIDQILPYARQCFGASGKKGRGRMRIVLRLRKDGSVKRADVTATGSLEPSVASCVEARMAKATFRMRGDTPRFLSFPVVLPER